jgi:hypothetical protein
MISAQRWIIGISLAAAFGTAMAGEDSTERWLGIGPAYWESACGLPCFNAGSAEENAPASQP